MYIYCVYGVLHCTASVHCNIMQGTPCIERVGIDVLYSPALRQANVSYKSEKKSMGLPMGVFYYF